MQKSLFRAYIFSLLIFIGINFLLYITMYSFAGLLNMIFDRIANHPTYIAYTLIYPSSYFPWELIFTGIEAPSIPFTIMYIGGVVTFIIAAIVAGLMGGDIIKSFGGWIITCGTYMAVHVIILVIDDYNLNFLSFSATLIDGIIIVIITGVVNMLIFGGLVLLIAYLKGTD